MAKEIFGPVWSSFPRYASLRFDPSGKRHIFVAQGSGGEALIRRWPSALIARYERSNDGATPSFEFHYARESSSGKDFADEITELLGERRVQLYPSVEALQEDIRQVLSQATVGVRLYVAGSEIFVWTISAIAREYGINEDEIQRELLGSTVRRVYCAHCKQISEDVTEDVTPCSNCGLTLEVYPHFSRLRRAYLGFKVDAEEPGNIPEPRESYT